MISIIIPAKNEEKNLQKTLPSLLQSIRTYPTDYEIIVVDNNSSDSTVDISKKFGCRLISLKNGTVAKLRNEGAKLSRGNILCFLDADCVVPPNWLKSCMDKFDQFPELLIVGSPALADFESGTWVEKAVCSIMAGAPRLDRPRWIGTSNLLIRKVDFFSVNGFDEDMVTGEDYDFCEKINISNNRILLNKSCPVLHLGESKTLLGYLKKEFWRGQEGRLEGFTFNLKDNYTRFIMTFIIILAGTFFSAFYSVKLAMAFALVFMSMPFIYVCLKLKKIPNAKMGLQMYIVASVYLVARSASFLKRVFVSSG